MKTIDMKGSYFTVIVCLVHISKARKEANYNIGKEHCPCTHFCSVDKVGI